MDPQQQQQPSPPTTGGRDDCWSEGASKTLIDAWGERYLHLNRGNLRQKDWKEVAEAVNSRNHAIKPPRTDVQCKNRIDTLKKKYKLEKSRPSASNWFFYTRLDYLIGNSSSSSTAASAPNNNPSVPDPNLSTLTIKPMLKYRTANHYSKSNETSLGPAHDDHTNFSEDETPYTELARAISRFGEIYERIESSKQEQLMELEKQRMEFTKDLEFQRINMFTEAHLQLKFQRTKKKKKPINNNTPGSVKKL